MQLTEAATLDRKSGEAEGSAVPRPYPGNVFDNVVERSTVSGSVLIHALEPVVRVGWK